MHTQQRNWVNILKVIHPEFFKERRVLEIGSAVINGSIRDCFEKCDYTGIDVLPYEGVDIVCVAHEFKTEPFDVVCSTSSLEHDMYWVQTLGKMVELLNSRGLMFFSCGSKWQEHGTLAHDPNNSLTTKLTGPWSDYYRNLTANDVVGTIDLNETFKEWHLSLDSGMDLTFWGIKL